MRPRTTLILLLLALVTGAVILLWEKDVPGTDQQREMADRIFPELEPDRVVAVEIDRAGAETVHLVNSGERWRIEAPIADRASAADVEELVRQAAEAKSRGSIPADQIQGGDQATGLGQPALRLTLRTEKGERVLEVGGTPAPGGWRYARREDSPELHLIEAGLVDLASKDPQQWRDKNLLDLSTVDVQSFWVEHEGRRLAFARRGGEQWWILEPIEDQAASADVHQLLSKLVSLHASRIAPPEQREGAGLNAPAMSAELETAEGTWRVNLGAAADQASATAFATVSDRDALFVVPSGALYRELEDKPGAWRSRSLLDFSPWDVEEFDLEREGFELHISRVEGETAPDKSWIALEPDGFALDGTKAGDLLSRLSLVKAERVAAGERAPGPAAATLRLRFRNPERQPDIEVQFGPPAGEGLVWARRQDRPTPLIVSSEFAELIDPRSLGQADEQTPEETKGDLPAASSSGEDHSPSDGGL